MTTFAICFHFVTNISMLSWESTTSKLALCSTSYALMNAMISKFSQLVCLSSFVLTFKISNEFVTFIFLLFFQDGHEDQVLSSPIMMTFATSNSFITFHFFEFQNFVSYFWMISSCIGDFDVVCVISCRKSWNGCKEWNRLFGAPLLMLVVKATKLVIRAKVFIIDVVC